MQTSELGLNVIRSFEGRALRAYKDSVGVVTIGYGSTNYDPAIKKLLGGRSLRMGDSITAEQAEALFVSSIRTGYEPAVNKALSSPTQAQFDAGASFHFNTGAIAKASWPKALNSGDMGQAKASILSWNKAGGRVLSGLTRRRKREWAMIESGDYGPEGRTGPVEIGADGRPTGRVIKAVPAPSALGQAWVDSPAPASPGMLKKGDSGPYISDLQEWLVALGYLKGKPTGSFDDATEAAVEKFQGHHPNLTKDGVVGPATRNALARDLDMRDKAKDTAKKAAVGIGFGATAWGTFSAVLGKALLVSAGVLAVLVLAYIAFKYRDEIRTLVNRMLHREVD